MSNTRKYLDRRLFLKTGVAFAATQTFAIKSFANLNFDSSLFKDPLTDSLTSRLAGSEIYKIPEGFRSFDLSKKGEVLSNGGFVPPSHDGMACFDGTPLGCKYVIVRNHEVSGFFSKQDTYDPSLVYDERARGGTTTFLINENFEVVDQYLSLTGTLRNCSGGVTPWNTWISCEESFETAGSNNKAHGFAFEVDPFARGLNPAIPLVAMGQFKREGVAIPVESGIVYQTEDETDGCVYRFLPEQYGDLTSGRLQVLKLVNPKEKITSAGVAVEWIDLNPNDLPLRKQAKKLKALQMKAPEGIVHLGEEIIFTAAKHGYGGLGQILHFSPAGLNGGVLKLVFESTSKNKINNPDQMALNKWGDIIVCEDSSRSQRILGLRPDGKIYFIASNTKSEWTGVCFSPDQEVLFANIQGAGVTVAVTGDWESLRNSV